MKQNPTVIFNILYCIKYIQITRNVSLFQNNVSNLNKAYGSMAYQNT